MSISFYLNSLTKKIKSLDTIKMVKFATWCLWPLTQDATIKEFLDKINGNGTSCYIQNELKEIWRGNINPEKIKKLYLYVTEIDWIQDEIDNNDEFASQGAMDLLGGVSSLCFGYLDKSAEYLTNCSEMVINRVQYLIDFKNINADALNIELRKQQEAFGLINDNKFNLISLKERDTYNV